MERPFPSHRSLARYALEHLDLQLLEALLERLVREREAHLAGGEASSGRAPALLELIAYGLRVLLSLLPPPPGLGKPTSP
ncbi:hypothetical protein [Thermus sp.]|uniref:hypothetical protein n=1 Tax=Thermus sp. TaxID=275 RepID=UPI003D0C2930